jgi:hypothetical protein
MVVENRFIRSAVGAASLWKPESIKPQAPSGRHISMMFLPTPVKWEVLSQKAGFQRRKGRNRLDGREKRRFLPKTPIFK